MPVLDTSLSNGVDDVTNAQAYTELIDGATFLEALMPQRLNRYDCLLTCSVAELIAG